MLILHVILDRMGLGESNFHQIEILINAWEIPVSRLSERLKGLIDRGVHSLATFVPWQWVEADTSQQFAKFVQACVEHGVDLRLIVTPEVGMAYPYAGIPKELSSQPETWARNAEGVPFVSVLPPQVFALPSWSAAELERRYASFQVRIAGILNDVEKAAPQTRARVRVWMTGSFFKYYRLPHESCESPFGTFTVDQSLAAQAQFRTHLNQRLQGAEYQTGSAGASPWHQASHQNRHWKQFASESEEQFRTRSVLSFRRKNTSVPVQQVELWTPEADPSCAYWGLLSEVAGRSLDTESLEICVEELTRRQSAFQRGMLPSFVHWTALGPFRRLPDTQRQYFLFKSALLVAQRGGGLLLDEDLWNELSLGFQKKLLQLQHSLNQNQWKSQLKVAYLVPQLWSKPHSLYSFLKDRFGDQMLMIDHPDVLIADSRFQMLVVDPAWEITREQTRKWLAWSKAGRTLVIAQPGVCTESARKLIDEALVAQPRLELTLGVSFVLKVFSDTQGKLLVFNEDALSDRLDPLKGHWRKFAESLRTLLITDRGWTIDAPELQAVELTSVPSRKRLLFILNSKMETTRTRVRWAEARSVSDGLKIEAPSEVLQELELEIPPGGILALRADFVSDEKGRHGASAGLASF